MKLPTGKYDVTNDDGEAAERTLQPGTGTIRSSAGRVLARVSTGARITYGDPLGPHPLLLRALERRLPETALQNPAETGVVLAAAGSSDPEANATIARLASTLLVDTRDDLVEELRDHVAELIGPIAKSNNLIMPRRSTNSATATIPDTGVNDGSGAPTRTRRRTPRISRTLPT